MMNLKLRQVELTPLYEPLIYPKTYPLFEDEKVLAIGAFIDEQAVGLITCFAYSHAKEALLASFYVDLPYRNQSIGTKLMNHLLATLKEREIKLLYFHYSTPNPTLERILNKSGWKEPRLLTRRYFLDQYSFHPDWYFSPYPLLPSEFSLFPWSEAKPEEEELAKRLEQHNLQTTIVDSKFPIDTLTSLGLRRKDQLAGWIVNHRLEPKLLRYSAFYLLPEIRGVGPGIYLLKESIRQHLKNEIDLVGMMEINFKFASPSWIRFIKNRLAPYAFKIEDTNYAYNDLS